MRYYKVVEHFLKYMDTIDRSQATIISYRKELDYFGNFIVNKYGDEKELQDISLEDLEDYMYRIKKRGMMSSTRSRVIYILRSFYNYAYQREFCEKKLALYLEPVKVKKKERFYLNDAQIQELFAHINHPLIKVAAQSMYYTGIRVSELINLKMNDLDMEKRLIYVIDGKGKKDRKIPVSEKLYKILDNYLKNIRPEIESDKLFCTKRTGELSAAYINLVLIKSQEDLNFGQNVSAHILRHSFASRLIKANVPLPYVQKLLGHADLRVTSLYIHQDVDELRGAVDEI